MMNTKTLWALLLTPLALLSLPAQAALKVMACEPEWGALAQELGGSLVEVSVATSALHVDFHANLTPVFHSILTPPVAV